jgi:D-glycero-alpha-D-manno-heptose-7-phosphate kinase
MLIARAPVRISFAGGGTDLEAYYAEHGGMVVSATIDKYFYVFLTPNQGGSLQLTSSDYRAFYRHANGDLLLWDGDLRLPKAILHEFGIEGGLSIFLASEVPPGTGLGSSSTVAVALVKALSTYAGRPMSRQEIAELACHIEIDKLGEPIGRQDQYAAAFGGINAIYFEGAGTQVERLEISVPGRRALEQSLLLFFTGSSRHASQILREQSGALRRREHTCLESLHFMKAAASECRRRLLAADIEGLGDLLHQCWSEKKKLARGISNPQIDHWYEVALRYGALGGKVTGAGGGGFLLLVCPLGCQAVLTEALEREGLYRMDFHLEDAGAKVLRNSSSWLGMEVAVA